MQVQSTISVGVVDDHPVVRRGIVSVLEEAEGFGPIHQGNSARDAIAIAREHEPDVMVLDLQMPGGGGAEAVRKLSSLAPKVRCMILTFDASPDQVRKIIGLGAFGYALKGTRAAELVHALRLIADGKNYISPELASRMLFAPAEPMSEWDAIRNSLSARELQVVAHLLRGQSNRQIANELRISENTVKFHMSSIMQKLGVKNRVEAVINLKQVVNV